ncbi:MAG: flagellar basal-body MS-ring/collar protein FliF, partial [Gemmataceae bacterium]
ASAMQFLRQLFEQLRGIYQGMSRPRRISLLALTGVCLAAIFLVGYLAFQTDYQVLYSGLSAEDAGAITGKLQAQSVPFRLSTNGTTILVPAERVAQLRLDLAAEGVPSKGKGFEIFDEMNVGMTPFLQHVNLDRALQAELARTIMQVEPVVQARVHLVRPEPTPFVREQKPATASVILKLKPGAVLSRTTAQGIVALVSRSVEGLAPEQVTLVDTTGRILSDAHGDTPAPVTTQMEYRREMEAYLSNRAEEMLSQLLGPGRAVVRVTAEVNVQHQKTRKERYDPEQRVLVKETVTNHKSVTGTPARGGAVGVASNLPNKTAPPPSTTQHHSNDNEENTDSEWRATKIEEELEEGRGNVERLTVAALLDLSRPEGAEGAGLTLAEAEEIIKQAVGFKKGRDEIKVNDVKLASGATLESVEAEYQQAQRMRWYLSLARNLSLGVTALVALLVGFLYYRRLRPKGQDPSPATKETTEEDALSKLLREDPERLAKVLARWLEEPETPVEQKPLAA